MGKKMLLKAESEKYRALLERREEIRIEVNKLMEEYKALGEIIIENTRLKEEENKKKEIEEER
jgi:hypothetical protein